jgi:4-amino-4-deoxy-L-arabinose transferase-like glycosyltransferase
MQLAALTRPRQFRALAAAVCVALILPRIAQAGMFVDGVTYAVLARNLAAGTGTFWAPSFSTTVYPVFYEQPPLGLALESLAFRVLGDHLYVERLFSVTVFALTALLIVALWRRLLPRDDDWLPLFFWILPSTVTWAAINNMLEGTQALFTSAAVLLLMHATLAPRTRGAVIAASGAAVAVIAAVLTKGPVGLFPLAIPPLALLLTGPARPRFTRMTIVWITLLIVTGSLAATILAMPDARHSLAEFARTHVVPALQGERGLPRRSFDIARHFTLGILARMGALAAVLWLIRPRTRHGHGIHLNAAGFFFGAGLLASLPLLASPVLAGHYFLPSVPLFALAMATVALPAVEAFRERTTGWGRLVPAALAAGLFVLSIAVPLFNGPMEKRDVGLVDAVRRVGALIPGETTIATCANAAEDWGLHGYFQRFYRVSLAASDAAVSGFLVVRNDACAVPPQCSSLATRGELILYSCPGPASRRTPRSPGSPTLRIASVTDGRAAAGRFPNRRTGPPIRARPPTAARRRPSSPATPAPASATRVRPH